MWYNFIPFLVTTTMNSKFVPLVLCLPLASAGNNLFASQIYTQLGGSHCGNFLVSPWSAETILGMTAYGATDAAFQQLATVLHLPGPAKLYNFFNGVNYTIHERRKVYMQDGYSFKQVDKDMDMEENINFTAIGAATATLNEWIERRTKGKITRLFNPSDLDDFTKVVFVNALYFKANWSERFTNYESMFYWPTREQKKVYNIQTTAKFKYYASAELKAQFLEVPLKDGDATFTIVLPDKITGLVELEEKIEEVLKTPPYSQEVVNLSLPKFRIESRFKLNKALQKLGATKIFRETVTDFSGLASGEKEVLLNGVLQKSFLEVDGGGVEGAAANSVSYIRKLIWFIPGGMIPASLDEKEVIAKNFVADHPFIFYIKVKDNIVFIGRVVDPTF